MRSFSSAKLSSINNHVKPTLRDFKIILHVDTKSLLNCAPGTPSHLSALPIIDMCLCTLPISNMRLTPLCFVLLQIPLCLLAPVQKSLI